jgi:PAS domain S-box-containing protein
MSLLGLQKPHVQRRIAMACAVGALLGGVLGLLGWVLHLPVLTDWFGVGIAIMPNSALGIALSGIALYLRATPASRFHAVPALVAAALGLATLLQHLFAMDLGIDQLLFSSGERLWYTMAPGRMGPPAAALLFLVNLALLVSMGGYRARRWSSMLAVFSIAVALLSIIGFLYGADTLYTIPHLTAISITSAVLFLLLSSGLIALLPDVEPMRTLSAPTAAGALVRRALPLLILLPLVVGGLRLWAERMGLFDATFGTALRTLVEIFLLVGVLFFMARAVGAHERSLRRSESDLRSAEQRYRAFMQHSSEGIWRAEIRQPLPVTLPVEKALDGIYSGTYIAECNDAMARMYGYTHSSELVGRKLSELLPRSPENEAYLTAFWNSGFDLKGGESQEIGRGGSLLWFSNNLLGIVENGHLTRAWGIQQDITQRKQAEHERKAIDQRKDEFLATLAHELRNPLAPLMSGVEILTLNAMERSTDAEEQRALSIMERQLHHIVRLVDDLLDISRINRGKITLRRAPLDLIPIVRHALRTLEPELQGAQHRVQLDLPKEPVVVQGDAVRLAQVFQNIIHNACKYTPAKGCISICAHTRPGHVVVQVQDTGIGLSPQHLHSIFEMFSQVDTSPGRGQSGLGIGLALVKRLVEKHKGIVSACSDGPGKGTTIRVELPLLKEAAVGEE